MDDKFGEAATDDTIGEAAMVWETAMDEKFGEAAMDDTIREAATVWEAAMWRP